MESTFIASLQRATQLYQRGYVPAPIRQLKLMIARETRELNRLAATTSVLNVAVYRQMDRVVHLRHHLDALYHQWVMGYFK